MGDLSFTKKILEIRVTLATGSFSDGSNTKTMRIGADVTIDKPGGEEKNKAKVKLYNVKYDDMQVMTSLAFEKQQVQKNVLSVYAGDEEKGLSLAFKGDIVSAVPDFNAAPDPTFNIDSVSEYVASVTPVPPLTGAGEQDVATLLQRLATQMELSFINRGVNTKLRNVAFVGGPMQQAQQIAAAARISLICDDGEMVIAPPGEFRTDDKEGTTPVWKFDSGMFGYPSFDNEGINVRGLYEPKLQLGGPIRIESIVPKASGLWQIQKLTHNLQTGYPGARKWESTVKASYPGQKSSSGKGNKDDKKTATKEKKS